jgi:putative phosphonate catabolism associated alcohol dehydrogenase
MALPKFARAAVMTAPRRDLDFREYPLMTAPPGGALVRVRLCTICKSDLHTWTGRRTGPTPTILGHEIVGTIAQLGEGLTHDANDQSLSVGDRVTWTLHSCCGKCAYCTDLQLPMKCRSLRKYGHEACDAPPHLRGGFAEYCVLDAGTKILKLPAALSDVVAAPANCAVATIQAGWEAANIKRGESVLIQGAGALGCYATALAVHSGCRRVIVIDVNAERLEFVRLFGATDCIDASQIEATELVRRIKDLTDGFGVDCAFEVAGAPAAVEAGLMSLRIGGRYIEIGCSFPESRVSLDMSLILWNRLTICGVHNYDFRHLCQAVALLAETRARFPYEKIVGESYPLDEIQDALQAAETDKFLRVAVVC